MSAVATTAVLAAPPGALTTPRQPAVRAVPGTGRPGWSDSTVPRAYRPKHPLGDPTPLVCTVARTALEVALGQDGIHTLTRWITPELRASLQRQHSLARRAGYVARGRVGVVRVRLCRVGPKAVEAAIVATEGDAARAIAMRLEDVTGRWLVTALDVG